jgi:hypothetical protein
MARIAELEALVNSPAPITPEMLAEARKLAAQKAWVTIRAKREAAAIAEAARLAEVAAKEAAMTARIAELEAALKPAVPAKRKRA